jgi:glutamyl-tRNA reductase
MQLVGLNHRTAPVALRERLFFGAAAQADMLQQWLAQPGVSEVAMLSTCNRTEIVMCGADVTPIIADLACRAQRSVHALRPLLYHYTDRAAAAHLFRVACGLDSLALGETQILKQLRDALATAVAHGSAGRQLQGLFQHAIATGKRARCETTISQGAYSIGRAGVELARVHCPDLTASPVLVLGAGKMSELTAKHLAEHGVHTIFVANRTYAHAVELAERLGGRAIHYAQFPDALTEVDILISSTSSPHLILHAERIAAVMAQRPERPLCLIDIAVPRDIDPAAGSVPNVHLYNIDDLRQVTDADLCRRQAEIPTVEAIIAEEVERWRCRQAGLDVTAAISALRHSFEQVRQAELLRATPLFAELTPEQQAAVEGMTASLVNKLLHTPTVRLKETLAAHPDACPQRLLCDLFALEPADMEEHP